MDYSKMELYSTPDEKIIWEGKPNYGYSKKQKRSYSGEIFIILFMLVIQTILILSVVFEIGDGAAGITFPFIVIFATTLLFTGIALYSIINGKFFSKKKALNEYYVFTNKRIYIYDKNKEKISCGNLINYSDISCQNKKCGSIFLGVVYSKNLSDEEKLKKIKEGIFKGTDNSNLLSVTLYYIDNPKEVIEIIKEARKVLIENKEIPTIKDIEIY